VTKRTTGKTEVIAYLYLKRMVTGLTKNHDGGNINRYPAPQLAKGSHYAQA
jgi:hypothetical protein